MLYNVMQQTENGTITVFNTVDNNAQAHEMLANAETVTIGANGPIMALSAIRYFP